MRLVSVPLVGFGDGEGLQAQVTGCDPRQVGLFLRLGAVAQDRAHDVHLGVACSTVAARFVNFFQDRGGGGNAESAAAVLLGDQDAEEAGLGQGAHELGRIGALPIQGAPIDAREPGAERFYRGADVGEAFAHRPFPVTRRTGFNRSTPMEPP